MVKEGKGFVDEVMVLVLVVVVVLVVEQEEMVC